MRISYENPEIGIEKVRKDEFNSKTEKTRRCSSHERGKYATAETIEHVTESNTRVQEDTPLARVRHCFAPGISSHDCR